MSITISDITVDRFKAFAGDTTLQQVYVDYANADIIDIANQYGILEADISTPWHPKLISHAKNVCVYQFAIERIGSNISDSGTDVYAILAGVFDANKQESRAKITEVMFTGETQDETSRAVDGVRLELG